MKGKNLQATQSKDSAASSPLPSLNFREAQVLLCHLESAWLGLGHREWARRTQAEKDQTDFVFTRGTRGTIALGTDNRIK